MEYWKEEQNELSITIANSNNNNEINKAFTALLPALNRMIDSIIFRYFAGNTEARNDADREDLKSIVIEKVYLGLINKYDGVSSSFSYVQTIIKNGLIDHFIKNKNIFRNKIESIDAIEYIEVEDEEPSNKFTDEYQYILQMVRSEIVNPVNKNKVVYKQVLQWIDNILSTSLDKELHYILIGYYITQMTGKTHKKAQEQLYKYRNNTPLHLYRLIVYKKDYKNFNYSLDNINELNNALHRYERNLS